MTTFDLAVVGAGPAGLAAAVTAAAAGMTTVLIDAEPQVGGQFWRHPAPGGAPDRVRSVQVRGLHHDLGAYGRLRRRLRTAVTAGSLVHLAQHEVWGLERTGAHRFELHVIDRASTAIAEHTVTAAALVLATGAHDLQLPFPGWTLPGVMTAGGAQALLKGHATLPGRRTVVAGTGPFLLSVATGLARSGGEVPGVFDSARPRNWLAHGVAVAGAPAKLAEGAGYAADLLRYRIGYHPGWTVVRAEGADRLESVTLAPLNADGSTDASRARVISADVLAVGWGFVPQLELPLMLGCATTTDASGLPVISVDAAQRSSVGGVFVAGETCGVGGAALAVVEGEIAGAAAASIDISQRLRARRRRLRHFAAAMQRASPVPPGWIGRLRQDTVVCRCEEVTAGAIEHVARTDGAADARTVKLLARPGMGWCQGRICGYATECLAAEVTGTEPRHSPVERPIATPLPLGALTPTSSV